MRAQYVRWLSRKTGQRYRLLSESEWEYVARAGTTTRFNWGDEVGYSRANCAGCGSRWDSNQTSPLGSFSPNAFGLYDVHGNVWEWSRGLLARRPSRERRRMEVRGPRKGDCSRRVLRGGSAISSPWNLRSASRGRNFTNFRNHYIGFRSRERAGLILGSFRPRCIEPLPVRWNRASWLHRHTSRSQPDPRVVSLGCSVDCVPIGNRVGVLERGAATGSVAMRGSVHLTFTVFSVRAMYPRSPGR